MQGSLRWMGVRKGPRALGLIFTVMAAIAIGQMAELPWLKRLQVNALTLAILAGILLGNSVYGRFQRHVAEGVAFSQQKLLRMGVMLYGVRLSLQDISAVGASAILLDVLMVSMVILFGLWFGVGILKMDRQTALLTAAGSGICGAAAVLATDRILNSEPHKASIAVATVVLFGAAAMFIYPMLYPLTGFSERTFGIYTGATVHEVAQAIAAGHAVGETAGDAAVVTKMMRVLLLAPFLMLVSQFPGDSAAATRSKMQIPWFVLGFAAVIVINSVICLPAAMKAWLIELDTILLSSAMFALGLSTQWRQLRSAGSTPLLLGAVLFALLAGGGYVLTAVVVGA